MTQSKAASVSTLHDFRDAKGVRIKMAVLVAATGVGKEAIRNRLKCYREMPTDLPHFLKLTERYRALADFRDAVEDLAKA